MAHKVRVATLETIWLPHVNLLLEHSIEKSGSNVHLMNVMARLVCQRKQHSYSSDFGYRRVRLIIIEATSLGKSFRHQTRFISVHVAGLIPLDSEHPLAIDDVLLCRFRNEFPRFVLT